VIIDIVGGQSQAMMMRGKEEVKESLGQPSVRDSFQNFRAQDLSMLLLQKQIIPPPPVPPPMINMIKFMQPPKPQTNMIRIPWTTIEVSN
jgi:hypothetical protein